MRLSESCATIEFGLGDVYCLDLPAGGFDLVHMRFVASTAGEPEHLIREAIRLSRPGGIVALQEPDGSTLNCYPPHPAWEQLKSLYLQAFKGVGADLELARRLYHLADRSGLKSVEYRTAILGVRYSDPMVDYLPSTMESLEGVILRLGLVGKEDLNSLIAECRRHLATPGTAFTMYTVAQVWGRS